MVDVIVEAIWWFAVPCYRLSVSGYMVNMYVIAWLHYKIHLESYLDKYPVFTQQAQCPRSSIFINGIHPAVQISVPRFECRTAFWFLVIEARLCGR